VTGVSGPSSLPLSDDDVFHTAFNQQADYNDAGYTGSGSQAQSFYLSSNQPDTDEARVFTGMPHAAFELSHHRPPPPAHFHGFSVPILSTDGYSTVPVGSDDIPSLGEPLYFTDPSQSFTQPSLLDQPPPLNQPPPLDQPPPLNQPSSLNQPSPLPTHEPGTRSHFGKYRETKFIPYSQSKKGRAIAEVGARCLDIVHH